MPRASHRGLCPRYIRAYADLWKQNQISHELTLSLGAYPARFDAETEFIPILRNLLREACQKVRGVPKRQLLGLTPEDPRTLFMAGFYEETDGAGLLNPHWHGAVSLRPGEEDRLREVLSTYYGSDAARDPASLQRPSHPFVKIPRSKPTFHLQELTTPQKYIGYASKKSPRDEPTHWTTYDIIG